MLPTFLIDSAVVSRGVNRTNGGSLTQLVRAVLHQTGCTVASLSDRKEQSLVNTQLLCSTSGCNDATDAASISLRSHDIVPCSGGHRAQLPLLLVRHPHSRGWPQGPQQRGVSTTLSAQFKFDSHLTQYNRSSVVNRDNFQRFRDSGRDARVAADILRSGGRDNRKGRQGGGGADDALMELRSLVLDCRDLQGMNVLVRECANDMDAFLVCSVLGRMPQMKENTPAAAAPVLLLHRVADAMMSRLVTIADTCSPSNFAHALMGLVNCGLLPSRPLLTITIQRLSAKAQRGHSTAAESDAKVISKLLSATARFMVQTKECSPLSQQQEQHATGGVGATGAGEEDHREQEKKIIGELLRKQLWPLLLKATEVKLLRALGEEAPGGGRQWRGADGPEEDDSMPQTALRFICFALAAARETHAGTWAAAARLVARHAAELQPDIAASILRSYAVAGSAAIDGGQAKMVEAVLSALQPQLQELGAEVQLDLLVAALKVAAARGSGRGAAAAEDAKAAAAVVPVLCDALAVRVPTLSVTDATQLIIALAELHSKSVSEAAVVAAGKGAPEWQTHSYGVLPRLLADLLVLRGVAAFGASKFSSAVLGLGLLGYADVAVWSKLAALALPAVARMDGVMLSHLLGGFLTAALAVEATSKGTAATPTPGTALMKEAYERIRTLIDARDITYGKQLFHLLRALAEWPLPRDGAACDHSTLKALADLVIVDEVAANEAVQASMGIRRRLVSSFQSAGLGEHALVARLGGGGEVKV